MKQIKNALIRSLGVVLFAFIPGMAVGGPSVGWFWGGVIGCATVFSSIIIFFGVQLAWDANLTDSDIEKGFRAAVAKQADDNPDIKAAVATSADDSVDFSDFGDLSELED